jgi:segregation and condensation protein B
MRGVETEEIDALVAQLNGEYDEDGCPYAIVSDSGGYRLALRSEFGRIRDKFYGRVREARLSQAAVEVLSLVAYNQPQTSEEINQQRGSSSGAILSQLVRRQLLRVERPETKPRKPRYYTTERFLKLFNLASLDELPRSEDLSKQ